mmetsp:Transcript_12132/g.14160  ORF Transcript_12132/g.14160 Transcript_12132/m.14160 type:complete len:449 (+) Transcript_12132:58-1404(+)
METVKGGNSRINLRYIASQLNSQLSCLGYPIIQHQVKEDAEISGEDMLISTFEVILGDVRNLGERAKNLETESTRGRAVVRHLESEKEKLELRLQCSKQDLLALNSKVQVLSKENKKQKSQYDAWMKELQVTIFKLEGQHKQRQAAANKRETEYERLRKRMQKLQIQKDKTIKRSIDTEPLPVTKTHGNHHKLNKTVLEEQLEQMERNLESSKVNELLSENEKLRSSLEVLHKATISKISHNPDISQTSEIKDSDDYNLPKEFFNLPATSLCDQLDTLQQKISGLHEVKAENGIEVSSNQDFDALLRDLEQAKLIIAEQDELLRAVLLGTINDDKRRSSTGNESEASRLIDIDEALMEEHEEMEREMKRLQRSKERLKVDHDLLLKEAEKLDQERTKFEEERFEERLKSQNELPKPDNIGKISLPIPPTPCTKVLLRGLGATDSPLNV